MEIEKLELLKKAAAEISEREGCFLYHVDVRLGGKGRRVCVYIDKEIQEDTNEKRGGAVLSEAGVPLIGATIEDCANVSRGLSLILDVEDLVPGDEYELEVSSPGLERILKEKWHFEKVVGEDIQVKTNTPVIHPEQKNQKRGIKTIRGTLKGVSENSVQIDSSETKLVWDISLDEIHKANVLFEYVHPGLEKNNKNKH